MQVSYHVQLLKTNLQWSLFRIGALRPRRNDRSVVISLTSYPARFEYLCRTLKTLIAQSVSVSAIRVYIEDKDFCELNEKLLNLEKYGVVFCPTISGWRAATKLIPELLREEANESFIIYLDDEIIYPRDLVKNLTANLQHYPDSDVIFNWGQVMPTWDQITGRVPEYSTWKTTNLDSAKEKLVVPLGVAGVLIRRSSIPSGVTDLQKFQEVAQSNDDLWFWCHAIQHGLKLQKSIFPCRVPIYWKGSQENALWHTNILQGENDIILTKMLEAFPSFKSLVSERKARDSFNS